MRIIAFDTETTGLTLFSKPFTHPEQPWPVSVTAINSAPDGKIEEVYSVIVKLPAGAVIHPKAQEVHGISFERTQEEGLDPKDVILHLRDMFRSAEVHSAYNLPFDNKVLLAMAHRTHPDIDAADLKSWLYGTSEGVCSMEMTKQFLRVPGTGGYGFRAIKLGQAYKRITGRDMEDAHDAQSDAMGALTILKHMLLAVPCEAEDTLAPTGAD